MARYYLGWVTIGGNMADYTGQGCSLVYFFPAGVSTAGPAVSEIPGTGIYYFDWDANGAIAYTARLSSDHYQNIVDFTYQDALGITSSSYGSTMIPDTVMGYLKRTQEILEGDQVWDKALKTQSISTRGSTTLIAVKTVTLSSTGVVKS